MSRGKRRPQSLTINGDTSSGLVYAFQQYKYQRKWGSQHAVGTWAHLGVRIRHVSDSDSFLFNLTRLHGTPPAPLVSYRMLIENANSRSSVSRFSVRIIWWELWIYGAPLKGRVPSPAFSSLSFIPLMTPEVWSVQLGRRGTYNPDPTDPRILECLKHPSAFHRICCDLTWLHSTTVFWTAYSLYIYTGLLCLPLITKPVLEASSTPFATQLGPQALFPTGFPNDLYHVFCNDVDSPAYETARQLQSTRWCLWDEHNHVQTSPEGQKPKTHGCFICQQKFRRADTLSDISEDVSRWITEWYLDHNEGW